MENNQILRQTELITSEALVLTIGDKTMLEYSAGFLKDIKNLQAEIESTFDPIIKKAHETWKEALNQKKHYIDPLENAEKIIKEKIRMFRANEEAKRINEEKRIKDEIRKREEEAKLQEAEIIMKTGNIQEANKKLNEEILEPIISLQDNTKVDGLSYRKVWRYKIVDFSKLPEEYKTANDSLILSVIRSQKENTKIQGIEVYYDETTISR